VGDRTDTRTNFKCRRNLKSYLLKLCKWNLDRRSIIRDAVPDCGRGFKFNYCTPCSRVHLLAGWPGRISMRVNPKTTVLNGCIFRLPRARANSLTLTYVWSFASSHNLLPQLGQSTCFWRYCFGSGSGKTIAPVHSEHLTSSAGISAKATLRVCLGVIYLSSFAFLGIRDVILRHRRIRFPQVKRRSSQCQSRARENLVSAPTLRLFIGHQTPCSRPTSQHRVAIPVAIAKSTGP
jgi:hypothetical protein